MKVAIYHDFNGSISIENVNDPVLDEEGVIIEVKASGICRSDWHGWKGHDADITLPHVPGHEFSGVVHEIGRSVKKFELGDRVTVPFCCGCGTCRQCNNGNQHICDHHFQPGFTHWGSFAQFVAIKMADFNLVKVSDTIDFISSASLGCRFITAYHAIMNQGKLNKDQFVAVHGCGGVGLSAIMIAVAEGAKVIAIDINDDSLLKAKSLGADYVINASNIHDVVEAIMAVSQGGVDVSLDALGSKITASNSINSLAKKGKHIQVGILGKEDHISVSTAQLIAREIEIIGSHGMPIADYEHIFQLIENGKINPSLLIDRTIELREVPKELMAMNSYNNSGMVIIDKFI